MSTIAVLYSPWLGFSSGLTAWFVVTKLRSGAINVATTGDPTNAVAGNIASWGTGFLCAVVLTFLFPSKFQSTEAAHVERANKIAGFGAAVEAALPSTPPVEENTVVRDDEKTPSPITSPPTKSGNEVVEFLLTQHIEPMDPILVKRATRLAVIFNVLFLVVAILFVPFLLFGGEWIFSRGAFTGWCVVSFLWVWCSMVICVVWPVVESWGSIGAICRG